MEYKVGDKVRSKIEYGDISKGDIASVYDIGANFIFCENEDGKKYALDVNEVERVPSHSFTERKLKVGEYGILSVDQGEIFFSDDTTPEQLREAAATLLKMADELEGGE